MYIDLSLPMALKIDLERISSIDEINFPATRAQHTPLIMSFLLRVSLKVPGSMPAYTYY
jgi:hypothetical protein